MAMPVLHIGHLESRLPIIQGGMGGGVSLSGLASAVTACGGIGVITSVGVGIDDPDFVLSRAPTEVRSLGNEIRKAKALASGPLGVNIMMSYRHSDQLMEAAVTAGADILFLGAGLPLKIPQAVVFARRARQMALVPIVSSAKAFELICSAWKRRFDLVPDAVVVEGPLAGGHLGFSKEHLADLRFSLENLLPPVLSVAGELSNSTGAPVPVIAAGGVYSGHDIRRLMALGAQGVQMATRFVATEECDASPAFKAAYVRAEPSDIIIIDSPLGLPGRAIRNAYLDDVARGSRKPFACAWQCLTTCNSRNAPYCIGDAMVNARRGLLDEGFAFAGSNAWRVDRITTVRALISQLCAEYDSAGGS